MVNLGELDRPFGGGGAQSLFASRVDALKSQAREIDAMRDEIRSVISRTAPYFSRPLVIRDESPQSVTLK
jgi:hypothetical protein